MNTKHSILKKILNLIPILFLVACAGTTSGSKPEKIVEDYLSALVNKDSSTLALLSCADWEPSALMELDSLQAVDVRSEGISCKRTGTDGEYTLVNCQGKIVASYNGEDQDIDIGNRNYQVILQDGENLVCGYQ